MRTYWIVWVVVMAVVVGGCATASQSLAHFPTRGQSAEQMQTDMAACETYAEAKKQELQAAGVGAVAGGLGGAALGAVSGAIGGGIGIETAVGAAVGALVGAFAGTAEDRARYKSIYAACIRSRGYEVGG